VPFTLDQVAAQPNPFTLPLTMENVLFYNETIAVPGSPVVSPSLINFDAALEFAPGDTSNQVAFTILQLNQTLAPFSVFGQDTGTNYASLDPSNLATGTIDVPSGQVSALIMTLFTNNLTGGKVLRIPNTIAGTWPGNATTLTLTISGPAAVLPFFTGFELIGNSLELSYYGGILQAAATITGPWSDVTNATSPFTIPVGSSNSMAFFRLRGQ
jgi:hypothetical protein